MPNIKTVEEALIEFHDAFNHPVQEFSISAPISKELIDLRVELIREETAETMYALAQLTKYPSLEHYTEVADGLADIVVVVVGTAVALGIPFDKVFAEVHKSNMAKLGPNGKPLYREDGKILKPEGWEKPDIWGILKQELEEIHDRESE